MKTSARPSLCDADRKGGKGIESRKPSSLDWGSRMESEPSQFDQTIGSYGQVNATPRFQSQKFLIAKTTATAVALSFLGSPICEGIAKAQTGDDPYAEPSKQKPKANPADKKKDPKPKEAETKAEEEKPAAGEENKEAAPAEKPAEGELNPDALFAPSEETDKSKKDDKADSKPEPVQPSVTVEVSRQTVELPEAESQPEYNDPATSSMPNVSMTGSRWDGISLDHHWDAGAKVYANSAFQSYSLELNRTFSQNSMWRETYFGAGTGAMMTGDLQHPFGTLSAKPKLTLGSEKWNVNLLYYGRYTYTTMNSDHYVYQGLGAGFSGYLAHGFRLRAAGFAAGGISSKYDELYGSGTGGLSLAWGRRPKLNDEAFLAYGMVTSYLAAPTAHEVLWIPSYRPRFQEVEVGAQVKIEEYSGRIFSIFGTLNTEVGIRAGRGWEFEKAGLDVFGGIGVNQWYGFLGGTTDATFNMGLRVTFGGENVNSTVAAEVEHRRLRGMSGGLPDYRNPGVFGFGRSGIAEYDDNYADLKQRMGEHSNLTDFAASYRDAPLEQKIMTLRQMYAYYGQEGYMRGAWQAMNDADFFDEEVERNSKQDAEAGYDWMRAAMEWRETHNGPLPPNLARGAGTCANAAGMIVVAGRAMNLPGVVRSVNTQDGPHTVAVFTLPDRDILMDWGNTIVGDAGSQSRLITQYGQLAAAPTLNSQLFRIPPHSAPNTAPQYVGTEETEEGRGVHKTIGIRSQDEARKQLGVSH